MVAELGAEMSRPSVSDLAPRLPLAADRTIRDHPVDASLFIGGRWEDSPRRFPVYDPATQSEIGTAPCATVDQVTAAVGAAHAAFGGWRNVAPDVRAAHLRQLHGRMLDELEPLAALLTAETGKPMSEARGEVLYAAEFAAWYAEEARRRYGQTLPGGARADTRIQLLPQPLGVVGAITAWNFPLVLAVRKLGAALAAGCTVVLKPSEEAPLSAYALAALVDQAGLPPGVVNLVTANDPQPVGDIFVHDPRVRKISFTGSVAVGKELMGKAASTLTRASLELGGHNPFVVLPDADLQLAAESAASSRLRNGGQTCVSTNRIYVHQDVEREFLDAFVSAMVSRVIGDGFNSATDIGPMIHHKAAARLQAGVDEAVTHGADALCGGGFERVEGLPRAAFYRPTVLRSVHSHARLQHDEIFGPVALVDRFRDLDEAVARANATEYGLAAYVFTDSLRSAMSLTERLEAGIIVINQASPSGVHAPQGGIKQSGLGLEGGAAGVDEFTYLKYVSIAM